MSVGYGTFIIIFAYCLNLFNLGNLSYVPAIIFGAAFGYHAYKHLGHVFIAALGALIGCIVGLAIIAIFNITNDFVVYGILIAGIIIGATQHFMDDKVELFLSCFVGAYLVVEGLTSFLGGLPSFIYGIRLTIHGDTQYIVAVIIYSFMFMFLTVYGYHYQRHK